MVVATFLLVIVMTIMMMFSVVGDASFGEIYYENCGTTAVDCFRNWWMHVQANVTVKTSFSNGLFYINETHNSSFHVYKVAIPNFAPSNINLSMVTHNNVNFKLTKQGNLTKGILLYKIMAFSGATVLYVFIIYNSCKTKKSMVRYHIVITFIFSLDLDQVMKPWSMIIRLEWTIRLSLHLKVCFSMSTYCVTWEKFVFRTLLFSVALQIGSLTLKYVFFNIITF